MSNRYVPTKEELKNYLKQHRNWGRWSENPDAGAVNLVTSDKRVEAAKLVKTGHSVSCFFVRYVCWQ